MAGMGDKSWQNPDLYKIARGLGTTDITVPEVPYLAQLLDAMEIWRMPTQNRLTKTFNITDIEIFQTALNEWYASGAASIIISTEWMEDDAGTKFYLITYA